MAKRHDLAVRWNSSLRSLRRIDRLHGVPLHGFPGHLKVPGGRVLVVNAEGTVVRIMVAKRIDGPLSTVLPSGKRSAKGYIVRARGGSLRRTKRDDLPQVGIRWHVVGQFRYYDAERNRAVFLKSPGRETPPKPVDPILEPIDPARRPYSSGIPGFAVDDPKSRLVDEYVAWLEAPERFEHRYMRAERIWTDLFDRSRWRLLVALEYVDRQSLRAGIGELLDYRRRFRRRPSLGLLLPVHPGMAAVDFIRSCGIVAIWRTPSGRFTDASISRARTV